MTLQRLIDMTKMAGQQARRAAEAASNGNVQAARRAASQATIAARDVEDTAGANGDLNGDIGASLATAAVAAAVAAKEVADVAAAGDESTIATSADRAASAGAAALAESWRALNNRNSPSSAAPEDRPQGEGT